MLNQSYNTVAKKERVTFMWWTESWIPRHRSTLTIFESLVSNDLPTWHLWILGNKEVSPVLSKHVIPRVIFVPHFLVFWPSGIWIRTLLIFPCSQVHFCYWTTAFDHWDLDSTHQNSRLWLSKMLPYIWSISVFYDFKKTMTQYGEKGEVPFRITISDKSKTHYFHSISPTV